LGLSIPELSRALSSAPPGPSPNAALYSAHQWQGRALHPDAAARMGLSASVLHGRRSHARAARLAGALQLRSTTRGAGPAATHESVPGRQQPHARSQLGGAESADGDGVERPTDAHMRSRTEARSERTPDT